MKSTSHIRLTILIAMIVLVAAPTFGQGGQRPGGRGQGPGQGRNMTEDMVVERVKRLKENLKLTDVQEKQITEFEIAQFKKVEVERQKFQGDREAMRAFMMNQREERDTKFKEVLTEEQYLKYKETQEQRREYRERPNQGSGSGDRPARGSGSGDRPARGRG